MEIKYDAFKIPVPTSPPEPIETSANPPVAGVQASMKTTDIINPNSAKSDLKRKYQEAKRQTTVSTPKRQGI